MTRVRRIKASTCPEAKFRLSRRETALQFSREELSDEQEPLTVKVSSHRLHSIQNALAHVGRVVAARVGSVQQGQALGIRSIQLGLDGVRNEAVRQRKVGVRAVLLAGKRHAVPNAVNVLSIGQLRRKKTAANLAPLKLMLIPSRFLFPRTMRSEMAGLMKRKKI